MNATVLIAAAAALIGSLLAGVLLPSKKRAVEYELEADVEPLVIEIAEPVAA